VHDKKRSFVQVKNKLGFNTGVILGSPVHMVVNTWGVKKVMFTPICENFPPKIAPAHCALKKNSGQF
jgi:hypothetical protein